MKKIIMMAAAVAMTAMTFTACNGGGSTKLNDDVDSIAYNLGVAQADGLKQYMSMQLGVDSAYIDEFIKGMKEGAVNEANPKKEAYMKGLEVGKQVQQMVKGLSSEVYAGDSTQTVNANVLLAGLIDGLKGKANISSSDAMAKFNEKLEPIKAANMEKQFGDNKKAGEKYVAENAKKEGVIVLDGGVQKKILVAGAGEVVSDTAKVKVNYEGRLIDGTVFDSSYERNMPFEVDLAEPRVIPGWVTALKTMKPGETCEVVIPYDQAYGAQNMGQIKPYSTLIFKIEMLK